MLSARAAGGPRARLLAGVLAAALACAACTIERTPAGLSPTFLRVADVVRVSDAAATTAPAWDPSGRVLAFGAADGVWRVGADGTDARRLAALPDVSEVAWAPDGRTLAVVSAGTLYAVGLDGLSPVAVRRSLGARLETWAPRGARLAYVVSDGDHDAVAVWQEAGVGRGAPARPVPLPVGLAVQAMAWSPDGGDVWLALAPQGQGAADRLVRVRLMARRPSVRLFAWRDTMLEPAFDPAGRYVAYFSRSPGAAAGAGGRLTVVRLDGTGRETLTPEGSYTGLSWAPAGTTVAFGAAMGSDATAVEIVDVTTGTRLRVTDYHPEISAYAHALVTRWSPDGRRLAFGTDAAGGRGPVWVATFERL